MLVIQLINPCRVSGAFWRLFARSLFQTVVIHTGNSKKVLTVGQLPRRRAAVADTPSKTHRSWLGLIRLCRKSPVGVGGAEGGGGQGAVPRRIRWLVADCRERACRSASLPSYSLLLRNFVAIMMNKRRRGLVERRTGLIYSASFPVTPPFQLFTDIPWTTQETKDLMSWQSPPACRLAASPSSDIILAVIVGSATCSSTFTERFPRGSWYWSSASRP
jgi:hypothetical protein